MSTSAYSPLNVQTVPAPSTKVPTSFLEWQKTKNATNAASVNASASSSPPVNVISTFQWPQPNAPLPITTPMGDPFSIPAWGNFTPTTATPVMASTPTHVTTTQPTNAHPGMLVCKSHGLVTPYTSTSRGGPNKGRQYFACTACEDGKNWICWVDEYVANGNRQPEKKNANFNASNPRSSFRGNQNNKRQFQENWSQNNPTPSADVSVPHPAVMFELHNVKNQLITVQEQVRALDASLVALKELNERVDAMSEFLSTQTVTLVQNGEQTTEEDQIQD